MLDLDSHVLFVAYEQALCQPTVPGPDCCLTPYPRAGPPSFPMGHPVVMAYISNARRWSVQAGCPPTLDRPSLYPTRLAALAAVLWTLHHCKRINA